MNKIKQVLKVCGIVVFLLILYLIYQLLTYESSFSLSLRDIKQGIPEELKALPNTGIVCWRIQKSDLFYKAEYITYVEKNAMRDWVNKIKKGSDFDTTQNASIKSRPVLFDEFEENFILCHSFLGNTDRLYAFVYFDYSNNIVLISSTYR